MAETMRRLDSYQYRAIDRNTGQFGYWSMSFLMQASPEALNQFFHVEHDFDMGTFGEWTGRKVREELIFEDDITEDAGGGRLVWEWQEGWGFYPRAIRASFLSDPNPDDDKIIGNIHQNKELLA